MADEVITMTPTLEEVEPIPEEVKTSQASIKAATTEPELTNGSPPNIEVRIHLGNKLLCHNVPHS